MPLFSSTPWHHSFTSDSPLRLYHATYYRVRCPTLQCCSKCRVKSFCKFLPWHCYPHSCYHCDSCFLLPSTHRERLLVLSWGEVLHLICVSLICVSSWHKRMKMGIENTCANIRRGWKNKGAVVNSDSIDIFTDLVNLNIAEVNDGAQPQSHASLLLWYLHYWQTDTYSIPWWIV